MFGMCNKDCVECHNLQGMSVHTAMLTAQVNASSSDDKLQYDVIMASLGARYNLYCASLTRTVMVDPSKQQEAEYK